MISIIEKSTKRQQRITGSRATETVAVTVYRIAALSRDGSVDEVACLDIPERWRRRNYDTRRAAEVALREYHQWAESQPTPVNATYPQFPAWEEGQTIRRCNPLGYGYAMQRSQSKSGKDTLPKGTVWIRPDGGEVIDDAMFRRLNAAFVAMWDASGSCVYLYESRATT